MNDEQRRAITGALVAGAPVSKIIDMVFGVMIAECGGDDEDISRCALAHHFADEFPDFAADFETYIAARVAVAEFFDPARRFPECPFAAGLVLLPSQNGEGQGLFYTGLVEIPVGANIANYPCDAILFKNPKLVSHVTGGGPSVDEFVSRPDFAHPAELRACCKSHAVEVHHKDVSYIAGCNVEPKSPFLAHMANDGIGLRVFEGIDQPTGVGSPSWLHRYYVEMVKRCNAVFWRHNDGNVSIVAAKKITVHIDPLTREPVPVEILVSYGPGYFALEKWPELKTTEAADNMFYRAPTPTAKKKFDSLLPPALATFLQPTGVPCDCDFCKSL